jgi:hypothetical protein
LTIPRKISFHHLTGRSQTNAQSSLETNKTDFHTALGKLEYIHAGKGNGMAANGSCSYFNIHNKDI